MPASPGRKNKKKAKKHAAKQPKKSKKRTSMMRVLQKGVKMKSLRRVIRGAPAPEDYDGATFDGQILDDRWELQEEENEEIWEKRRHMAATEIAQWYRACLQARRERAAAFYAALPPARRRIVAATKIQSIVRGHEAFKEIQHRLRLKSEEEGRLIAADALKEAERIADATRLQAMVRGALSRKHFDKARLRQIVEDERIRKAASQRLRESARDRRLREDEAAMEDRYLDDVTEGHHHHGHHHHRNSKESVAKQREDWANELKDAQREAAEVALGIRADSSSDDEVVDKKAEKDFDCLDALCGCCCWTSKNSRAAGSAGRRRRRRRREREERDRKGVSRMDSLVDGAVVVEIKNERRGDMSSAGSPGGISLRGSGRRRAAAAQRRDSPLGISRSGAGTGSPIPSRDGARVRQSRPSDEFVEVY